MATLVRALHEARRVSALFCISGPSQIRFLKRMLPAGLPAEFQRSAFAGGVPGMRQDRRPAPHRTLAVLKNHLRRMEDFAPGFCLTDMASEAFPLARTLGIKAVGLSNFTWGRLLQDMEGEGPRSRALLHMEEQAEDILPLAGADYRIHPHPNGSSAVFFSRFEGEKSSQDGPGLVLAGGAVSMNLHIPSALGDFFRGAGVHGQARRKGRSLGGFSGAEEALRRASWVVTKPSWSTCAEALDLGVPLLLAARPGNTEDQATAGWLKARGLALDLELVHRQQANWPLMYTAQRSRLAAYRAEGKGGVQTVISSLHKAGMQ